LNISWDFAFLINVTRNRGRVSKWVCPFGALRLVVNCLTLMTLNPKPSRLLEISSAGVSRGKWRITALIGFTELGGEGNIVEIMFLQVGFHG
jgi:hypothetical protein